MITGHQHPPVCSAPLGERLVIDTGLTGFEWWVGLAAPFWDLRYMQKWRFDAPERLGYPIREVLVQTESDVTTTARRIGQLLAPVLRSTRTNLRPGLQIRR